MKSLIIWALAGCAVAFTVFYCLLTSIGWAEKVGQF